MFLRRYVNKSFDEVLRTRYEQNPCFYYYSPSDFDNIESESYDIPGSDGVLLKGYFYSVGKMRTDRILVFDHGMGPGHRAYFKEMAMLILHGYTVYAYDHTGCCRSGGETIVSFAKSLDDLDHVMTALEKAFPHTAFSVIGHSWGGFSTLNIGALHPHITHLVAMSGFISVDAVMKQYLPGLLSPYRKEAYAREKALLPAYTDFDARESLQKTDAKILVIHSDDDKMVSYKCNFVPLQKALAKRENTVFLTEHGKDHHPFYTQEAGKAYRAYAKEQYQLTKKKKLETVEEKQAFRDRQDWDKLTEQDETLWNRIYDFLES